MINAARKLSGGIYECGVVNCARCGGLHSGVRFVPFKRPSGDSTHWAPCPTSGEPILFQVKQASPPPAECLAPEVHPEWCGCPAAEHPTDPVRP